MYFSNQEPACLGWFVLEHIPTFASVNEAQLLGANGKIFRRWEQGFDGVSGNLKSLLLGEEIWLNLTV